jgi:hypothetical protein
MSLGLTDMRGAADARWSGAAEAGGENCVCNFGIEVVGVEVFTQPLTSLGVLWMSRIGEDFEQLKVAPGAATILGRTPALSGGTGGTGQSLNDGQALFDQERMFPVVTEVVGVGEAVTPDLIRPFRVTRFSSATSSTTRGSPYCRPSMSNV